MTRVMISCGEPSGDLYAGALVDALRAARPGIEVFGFGGERLRAAGGEVIGDYEGLAVTGLTEALGVLPRSLAMLRRLVAAARAHRPHVLVVIDFPDFNFRLMTAIKRLGVPVVYYVTPQIWAWRQSRMKTMQRVVDRALPIFPFEEAIYREAGVDVRFVGHPLVDLAVAATSRDVLAAEAGLNTARPIVALLPGSRPNELHRLLPVMAAAVPRIRASVPAVQFLVACAPNLPPQAFAPLGHLVPPAALLTGRVDDVLAASDVVVTASGTATVQAALHERPMVVLYKLSPVTYAIGKRFVRVDTYAMANLVAGARVVPELIQGDCTPERVAEETVALLTDRARWQRVRARLAETRAKLGPPGASARAAEAVLEVADR
jgi:lipid-A-disaccharide synthase